MAQQVATLITTGRIPWQGQFSLGSGITAFSANLAPAAYGAVAAPTASGGYVTEQNVVSIEKVEDLEDRLNAAVSGSFNVYGVEVSGSASFLKDVKTSSKTITYLLSYKSYRDVNVDASQFQLTPAANALVNAQSWSVFRQQYGDYYISGFREEVEFAAVYVLTAQSVDSLLKVKAEISASRGDIFSASGSAAFKSACTSNNVTVTINIYESATSGPAAAIGSNLGDPSSVTGALTNFLGNLSYVKTSALLTHHSRIIPPMPRTIPDDSSVVADIANLYATIMYCNGMADDLPAAAQAKANKDLNAIRQNCITLGDTLYTNDQRRAALWQDIQAWQDRIEVTLNYQKFCAQVVAIWNVFKPYVDGLKDAGKTVPNNNGSPGTGPLTIGLSSSTLNGVHVNAQTQNTGHVPSAAPGWAGKTLDFNTSGNVVVGFTITPSWTDGTDGFWCLNGGGIGAQGANFALQSLYDRGLDFSITVYTIDAQDWYPS